MTDQEFRQTIDRIKEAVAKWVDRLGLKWWRDITMEYYRTPEDMKSAIQDQNMNPDCMADTHVDWQYCQAVVRWNVSKILPSTDEDIDYYVRHEFAHILIREMREWGDSNSDNKIAHEERVCTMLGQAFGWIYDAGRDSATSAPGGSSEDQST